MTGITADPITGEPRFNFWELAETPRDESKLRWTVEPELRDHNVCPVRYRSMSDADHVQYLATTQSQHRHWWLIETPVSRWDPDYR